MTEEDDDGDEDDDIDTTMFESDQSVDAVYVPTWRNKITKIPLKTAVNLCTDIKLSTNKTAKICQHLAKSGIKVPTPTQAVIKSSEEKEEFYIQNLKNEERQKNWQ